MAVFPDRIVLKNSSDDEANIISAIGTGGASPITQGELVLGLKNGATRFYTRDANGNIVSLGGTGTGAQYLGELVDVDVAGVQDHQILSYDQSSSEWVASDLEQIASINDLSDVNTVQSPPVEGQALLWDQSEGEWRPSDVVGQFTDPTTNNGDLIARLGGSTTRVGIGVESQVLTVFSGEPVWANASNVIGGGPGGSNTTRLVEVQTSTLGKATFTGIGYSGVLVKATATSNAWVVLYGSDAARTADAGRTYFTDPAPGAGVLAEFYVTAGQTVLASPGTTYFNNDINVTEAIYIAVRDQFGSAVETDVTITAYGDQPLAETISKDTFQSELAASTDFANFQSRIAAL